MSVPNRIALALGDPNGIGPEIALKALAAQPAANLAPDDNKAVRRKIATSRTAGASWIAALVATAPFSRLA